MDPIEGPSIAQNPANSIKLSKWPTLSTSYIITNILEPRTLNMTVAQEFEISNQNYTSQFTKGDLALPPQRKVAVVVCMDARIDPAKALGLEEGDAHVIRNAGGRVSDALRSIIISQRLLGTREIVVIHHTDCGMLTFDDSALRDQLRRETGEPVDHFAFLPFNDLELSVKDDVKFLKTHKLILDVPISGYIYDVKTGKINKVD